LELFASLEEEELLELDEEEELLLEELLLDELLLEELLEDELLAAASEQGPRTSAP